MKLKITVILGQKAPIFIENDFDWIDLQIKLSRIWPLDPDPGRIVYLTILKMLVTGQNFAEQDWRGSIIKVEKITDDSQKHHDGQK